MWIFSTSGIYSTVQHRDDPEKVIIRARVKSDLVALNGIHHCGKIVRSPQADYPFRIVASKLDWLCALHMLGRRTTYPNFKSAIKDKRRHDLLLRIWRMLQELEVPR